MLTLRVLTLSVVLFVLCLFSEVRSAEPMQRFLLFDEELFESSSGITIQVEPAHKTNQVVFERKTAWESASLNWFNIIEDDGVIDPQARYRMWYETYDIDGWPTRDDTSFCYAESRDGIQWTRPNLGRVEYQGSRNNNILFRQIGTASQKNRSRVHGTGVFIDLKAPPAARYRAVGQGLFEEHDPPYRIAGMHSADGLTWTRIAQPICDQFADSQYSGFYDSSRQRYVLYGRSFGKGRALGRTESQDPTQFPQLQTVMQADADDPEDSDLYNCCIMKYPYADSVYLAFPSLYQHQPDTLDIRLAVSRDGINWSRPDRDTPFIGLGPAGSFDSGSLYCGQALLRHGDELWLYYSGSPLKHGEGELENLKPDQNTRRYSRVTLPLDRFAGAVAGGSGRFTTQAFQTHGGQLVLNVRTSSTGSVCVALLDQNNQPIPGYSAADCQPFTGDSLQAAVSWDSREGRQGLPSSPFKLQVQLEEATVFAFSFADRKPVGP